MKLFDRIIVFFITVFWFVAAVFLWRFYYLAILPILGIAFIFLGGRKRV